MTAPIAHKRRARQQLRRRKAPSHPFNLDFFLERADAGEDEPCDFIGPGNERCGE
jgi:hypothetical protein